MRYFATAVSILLLLAVVWVVFFSGLIWGKKKNAPSFSKEGAAGVLVVLETNQGTIKIKLDSEAAPKTAANFAKLAQERFYDRLTFHRVIDGFMIQGGDPQGTGQGGPGYTIPAEMKLPHKAGAVAMARLGDAQNPERASSGSQFFIVLSDAPERILRGLDQGGYTVFGQVVEGMDAVDAIGKVATDRNDKPIESVIIKRAYVETP